MAQHSTDAGGDARRARMILWAVGGLVGLAIVVGAVAGTLREPVALDAGTPEGVVQRYVQAVIDGEHEEAVGHLTDEAARGCPVSQFRGAWVRESLTATLDEVEVDDGEARVRVRFHTPAEPPFGGDGYDFDEQFVLVRQQGAWRITGSPWPVHACERPS